MTTTRESIEATAAELGITMSAKFVPWSQSKRAGEKDPSLNWVVTLLKGGREFLTTDYSAGCGHCPSYNKTGRGSVDWAADIQRECEDGKARSAGTVGNDYFHRTKPILPSLADVLYALVSDADAIDYATFEEWASNYGYETDSRKAEGTYRACLEIGLKLRAALGEDGLTKLREAVRDY